MHQGPEVCISGVKFLIKCMKTLKAKEHMIVAANNILKRCFRKQGGFPSLYRRLHMLAVLSVAEFAEVGTSRTFAYDLLLKLLRRESQSGVNTTVKT
ncbi:hypothetical protein NC652_039627 [Populus alba x Populus x berolinensis]|nr:hypothetical protein NC652_039627 [Populus alba x Populus x berolinensis]